MASRPNYKKCRDCGYEPSEDEPNLSATGLCRPCGMARFEENLTQLIEHKGPYFDHWRRRGIAGYGGVMLDDLIERA